MKNKFLVLLVLGIAFFAGCSDDNKSADDDQESAFNGIYSTGSAERALDLKYSGVEFKGKSVNFNFTDEDVAELKLQGVVPGESETVFSNVQLESNDEGYTFSAEDENDVRTVKLNGFLEKGKLTLNVEVKFAENVLMKKWKLSSVSMTWLPRDYYLIEGKLNTGGVAALVSLGGGPLLKKYLQDITFLEDGNVVATYNAAVATDEDPEPAADWQESALNLAHYYVKDDICYVCPNVEMIMSQVGKDNAGRANLDPTTLILGQLLQKGIPVHFEISKSAILKKETIYMYVDETFIKNLKPLIPVVAALVPEDYEIPILNAPVKPILESLPGALDATTELKLGIKCNPIE